MSPRQANNKNPQHQTALEKMKATREAKALNMAAKSTSKPATAADAKSVDNQPVQLSPPEPVLPLHSFKIKKKPGTSKAEKEAAAAAKNKREKDKSEEKEEGEISSDEEDIVFTGRMNRGHQNTKAAPANDKSIQNKRPISSTARASEERKEAKKDEKKNQKAPDKNNMAKGTKEVKAPAPKTSGGPSILKKLKKAEVKNQSAKRKMLPESDDEGSEEEAIKPVKKPKTTKTGMNFENLPTKRKHAEEEETSHVKKQKTTEEIKRPILAPVKRTPAAKETKLRTDNSKNLLGIDVSKPAKQKPAPKKAFPGPTKTTSVPETKFDLPPLLSPLEVWAPAEVLAGLADRATSASSTGEAKKVARNQTKLLGPAPEVETNPYALYQASRGRKPQDNKVENKKQKVAPAEQNVLKKNKVEALKQSKPVVKVGNSLAVDLDPEQDALLDADMEKFHAELPPKIAAAVQAQIEANERNFGKNFGKFVKNAVKSETASVENDDGLDVFDDAQQTIKNSSSSNTTPPDTADAEDDNGFDEDFNEAFAAADLDAQLQQEIENDAKGRVEDDSDVSSVESIEDDSDDSQDEDDSTHGGNQASQQGRSNVGNSSGVVASNSNPPIMYARDRGYESDMSEEDPDSEPEDVPDSKEVANSNGDIDLIDTPEFLKDFEEAWIKEDMDNPKWYREYIARSLANSLPTSPDLSASQQGVSPPVADSPSHIPNGAAPQQEPSVMGELASNKSTLDAGKSPQPVAEPSLSEVDDILPSDAHATEQAEIQPTQSVAAVVNNVPTQPVAAIVNNGTAQSVAAIVNSGPYVGPNGFIGLPPLEEETDASGSPDDEDTEMLDTSLPEAMTSGDTPEPESNEDEDTIMWDVDDMAEIYEKHRYPVGPLGTVIAEEEITPTDLILGTRKNMKMIQKWEDESAYELSVVFPEGRVGMLRELGVLEEDIATYMKVHKRYENVTARVELVNRVPIPVATEDDDDDLPDEDEVYDENSKILKYQGFTSKDKDQQEDDVEADVPLTDLNAHPFGPINWL